MTDADVTTPSPDVSLSLGKQLGPQLVEWSKEDVMLYALSVGCGQDDPMRDLKYTTENTGGSSLEVLPTFPLILMQRALPRTDFGSLDRSRIVHAEQTIVLYEPIESQGRAFVEGKTTGVYPKKSGTLITYSRMIRDASGAHVIAEAHMGMFALGQYARGDGSPELPSRPEPIVGGPDQRITIRTALNQGLLYRLNADRNPLHSDPEVADRMGYSRPILHGLATFAIAARHLIHSWRAPLRISARFSAPVVPGEELTLLAWNRPEGRRFRVESDGGRIVLDLGCISEDH